MKNVSSAITAADVFLRKTAIFRRGFISFPGIKPGKDIKLKMENSVDLSFLEAYGENLKTVKEYILEERSGNIERKRKLNKMIKTMKDRNGAEFNQNIGADNNSVYRDYFIRTPCRFFRCFLLCQIQKAAIL